MEMELIADDKPTFDFISPVKAGIAVPIGLNTKRIRAFRTSIEKGGK